MKVKKKKQNKKKAVLKKTERGRKMRCLIWGNGLSDKGDKWLVERVKEGLRGIHRRFISTLR